MSTPLPPQLPQKTINRICNEALEFGRKESKAGNEQWHSVEEGYEIGATAEALRAQSLVEALEKIANQRNASYKNLLLYSELEAIAFNALNNYNKQV